MSSSAERNYYEILNSTSNASFDELKRNYKQLILQCHPDKLQQDKLKTATTTATDVNVDPNVNVDSKFVIINEAWNTLKDPVKRKHYDAELLLIKFQEHSNIFEHLTLFDMEEHRKAIETDSEYNQDNLETYYAYNCRCGGQYIIDESAATENGIYKSHQKAAISGQQQQQQQHNNDCANACQDFNVADTADVGDKNKVTDTNDCEVMVECSECSLVIILSNAKQQSSTSS